MDEYHKRFPNDEKFRERYTTQSSKFYRDKMMDLVGGKEERLSELRGYVHDVELPNHLMYRVDTLYNPDGYRFYEFLIEYNVKKPAEGIYYGCRGLTKEGFDHDHAVKLYQQEWNEIEDRLRQVLNNIFPEKDFSNRFKMTDNANTNTYWLFWISLYDDEDIKEVGLVATKIIRDVFKYYLSDRDWFKDHQLHDFEPKKIVPKTAFYNKNFEALLEEVKDSELFKKMILRFEEEGWIEASPFYEKAWLFNGIERHRQNIDFAAIMSILIERCGINMIGRKKGIPWALIEAVFIDPNGFAYENLRQQAGQMKNDTIGFWRKKIQEIIQNL